MRPSSNLRQSNPFSEWTISADDADARIARAIRICVGNYVREMYSEVLKEPIPPRIAKLMRRLDRQGVQSERKLFLLGRSSCQGSYAVWAIQNTQGACCRT